MFCALPRSKYAELLFPLVGAWLHLITNLLGFRLAATSNFVVCSSNVLSESIDSSFELDSSDDPGIKSRNRNSFRGGRSTSDAGVIECPHFVPWPQSLFAVTSRLVSEVSSARVGLPLFFRVGVHATSEALLFRVGVFNSGSVTASVSARS